jgi:hypothetical protein
MSVEILGLCSYGNEKEHKKSSGEIQSFFLWQAVQVWPHSAISRLQAGQTS